LDHPEIGVGKGKEGFPYLLDLHENRVPSGRAVIGGKKKKIASK